MKKISLILIAITLMLFAGCKDVSFNEDSEVICIPKDNITSICEMEMQKQIEEIKVDLNETINESEVNLIYTEGDLIDLNVTAIDPDGDIVTYNFSSPFTDDGIWQTEDGDAGFYRTLVLASDGFETVSKEIVIQILQRNALPIIMMEDPTHFDEGTNMVLPFNITDEDGDEVVYTIEGWDYGSRYPLDYESAGIYEVTITGDDGKEKVSETFTVIINNVNRPASVNITSDLVLVEGETLSVDIETYDPDGDDVTVEFGAPLDENGEWMTEIGDEGITEFTVTAYDGVDETVASFEVEVLPANKAPILEEVEDMVVEEGDTVRFTPIAYDPDGDDITLRYSGWMTSSTYTTTYDDEGEYIVTITVSDETHNTFQHVKVTVLNKNRAPIFINGETEE
ncbi:hypothetical protein C0585_06500 [Candidatus Woesearchaeota archaeon]|nr:MAG: hypothetical protein C0585_06500 [Candidatus Woesearchaeota archaeon]